MELAHFDTAGARVITVNEHRIDAAIAISFKDRMRELTDQGPDRIVVDMTQVDFIDSSGLGAIVAAMKQVGPSKSFELAGLSGTVQKVFKLTRMDTVFTIHATLETALGGPIADAG
ncbi:anti-sigma factor antagonist [Aliiroseovarius zhejiangensis]|uniref:Anti-sigma factor antagonist n=1 Tax=Aliiroseovarius zhejiangensis TaxID=1632025 RepID=A0ABQ3J8H7_9RHOB|nr:MULTISPECIES: STAS domain-containing protein [Aliiroseovarius]MCK8484284.1 STAS domain-containing protein [Aliiroseovarius sp. S2029]GHF07168.1 anti-sigma factor antagonist [Aliiroseovarius zhejiangensis]